MSQTFLTADAEAQELIAELRTIADGYEAGGLDAKITRALCAGAQMVRDIFARRFTGRVEMVEEGTDEAVCATTETSSQ